MRRFPLAQQARTAQLPCDGGGDGDEPLLAGLQARGLRIHRVNQRGAARLEQAATHLGLALQNEFRIGAVSLDNGALSC